LVGSPSSSAKPRSANTFSEPERSESAF
jgi:hypothetical protein